MFGLQFCWEKSFLDRLGELTAHRDGILFDWLVCRQLGRPFHDGSERLRPTWLSNPWNMWSICFRNVIVSEGLLHQHQLVQMLLPWESGASFGYTQCRNAHSFVCHHIYQANSISIAVWHISGLYLCDPLLFRHDLTPRFEWHIT